MHCCRSSTKNIWALGMHNAHLRMYLHKTQRDRTEQTKIDFRLNMHEILGCRSALHDYQTFWCRLKPCISIVGLIYIRATTATALNGAKREIYIFTGSIQQVRASATAFASDRENAKQLTIRYTVLWTDCRFLLLLLMLFTVYSNAMQYTHTLIHTCRRHAAKSGAVNWIAIFRAQYFPFGIFFSFFVFALMSG